MPRQSETLIAYYANYAIELAKNDYVVLPVKPGGKAPAQGREWQEKVTKDPAIIAKNFDLYGDHSIGIQGRSTPALDIDTHDPVIADKMLAFIRRELAKRGYKGVVPVRYGQRPKFLIPGRWADGKPRDKRTSPVYIAPDADPLDPQVLNHQVEIIGDKFQWVCLGYHSKAGVNYSWLDDIAPTNLPHAKLPPFDDEFIESVLDEFETLMAIGSFVKKPAGLNGSPLNGNHANLVYDPMFGTNPEPKTELNIAKVEAALFYYSATSIGRNYDAYLQVCFALQEWGDDGFKLFMRWSKKSPWHDPKLARHIFKHERSDPGRAKIGLRTLFKLAKDERGWDGNPLPDFYWPEDDKPTVTENKASAGADGDDLDGPSDNSTTDLDDDGDDLDGPIQPTAGLDARMDEYNKKFAVVKFGKDAIIVVKDLSRTGPGENPYEQLKIKGFTDLYGNDQIEVPAPTPTNQNKTKIISVPTYWLKNRPEETRYMGGLVFRPPGTHCRPDQYNLWAGLSVEPIEGDVSPWLELIEIAIPTKAEREFFINVFAKKFQEPSWQPNVFFIFKGKQGTGKDGLIHPIIGIAGKGIHGAIYDKPKQVVGDFNAHLEYKLIIGLNEAVYAGNHDHVNRVKSMVTSDTLVIEDKFGSTREVPNYILSVNMTNSDNAWDTPSDERRAVIIEFLDTLHVLLDESELPPAELERNAERKAFWKRYYTWAMSQEGRSALLHYLLQRDVSTFDARHSLPRGKGWQDQRKRSELDNPYTRFINEFVETLELPGIDGSWGIGNLKRGETTEMSLNSIRNAWEEFAKGVRTRSTVTLTFEQLMVKIYDLTGATKFRPRRDGERQRYVRFPPAAEVRRIYTEKSKVTLDPLDDDDEL